MAQTTRTQRRSGNWPPLAAASLLLALLAVMPSALNLPQSNPSQTLEYAPVPPNDNGQPSTQGNLASLGLAGSSSLSASGSVRDPSTGEVPSVNAPLTGATRSPRTKRCVGNPPRQTEDPFAPPCVGFFEGDNFGATYAGVSADEVRIVMYWGGGGQNCNYNGDGCQNVPVSRLYDLASPPEDNEFFVLRYYRAWQRYFNERYQTYGRFVHFYVFYNSGEDSPETRRAEAAQVYSDVRPFAALDYVYGNAGAWVDEITRRGVLSFGGRDLRTEADYRKHPGLVWSFAPTVERVAESFTSFLCTKVVPYPVSFSGNAGENGAPRKYGILHTSLDSMTQYKRLYELTRTQAQACGMKFDQEATYPNCPNLGASGQQEAAAAMAQFKTAGVTTIIWPGCWEGYMSRAARSINYSPEWLTADYRGFERSEVGAIPQDQTVWGHAWVITPQTLQNAEGGIPVTQPCLDAYLSVDPSLDLNSFGPISACQVYADLRQLFMGIQVAGPRLGPTSIEKGFRAIPKKASTNRDEVACFYDPGDYTCVKDAVAMWWDPSAAGANSGGPAPFKGFQGCWRVGDDGKRYLPEDWPKGDVLNMQAPGQICNLSDEY